MQTASTSALSCSVFGHNLVKKSEGSHELTCKTCHASIEMQEDGSVLDFPIPNDKINNVLQRLFLLEHRFRRKFLTA